MNIILVLIPLSLVLLVAAGWAFFWGVNHSQFDDLDTPALMPLCDDPRATPRSDARDTDARTAGEPDADPAEPRA